MNWLVISEFEGQQEANAKSRLVLSVIQALQYYPYFITHSNFKDRLSAIWFRLMTFYDLVNDGTLSLLGMSSVFGVLGVSNLIRQLRCLSL